MAIFASCLLLLSLFLPYSICLSIPIEPGLKAVPRDTLPAVPGPNDSNFVAAILDKVNNYRAAQDASALQYDANLANFAASLAASCDIDPKPDGEYGDIVTGGSPSIFGHDSWNDFSLIDASRDLIDGWYNANVSYTLDPTFELFPFGKSYTQLVWKSTSHLGCAWTPNTCTFPATSAFYLRCAFSPKGNLERFTQGNVSCNGCPGTAQQKRSADMSSLQPRASGYSFDDLLVRLDLMNQVNAIRRRRSLGNLAWNEPYQYLARVLARKCDDPPQQGETVGPPMISTDWSSLLSSIRSLGDESTPAFGEVMNPGHTKFGCSFNQFLCPGARRYLHCMFGSWAQRRDEHSTDSTDLNNVKSNAGVLQARQTTQDLSPFAQLCYIKINYLRAKAGLSETLWNPAYRDVAEARAQNCNKPSWPNEAIGIPIRLPALQTPLQDATERTLDAWINDPTGNAARLITDPSAQSFGCAWNQEICPGDNWFMHCMIGPWTPQLSQLEARQNTGSAFADVMFTRINKIRADAGRDLLEWSQAWANIAKTRAFTCPPLPVEDQSIISPSINVDGAHSPNVENTLSMIVVWDSEPHTDDPTLSPNYAKIVSPKWRSFGCAWNGKPCHPDRHYLYCYFGTQTPAKARDESTKISSTLTNVESVQQAKREDLPGYLGIDITMMQADLLINMLPGLNDLREDAGVPPVRGDRSWNLTKNAVSRGAICSDFKDLSDNQVVLNYEWSNLVLGDRPNFQMLDLVVPQLWNETRFTSPDDNTSSYVKVTQPQWDVFGCAWSRNCTHSHSYIFYCEFGDTPSS